MEDIRPDVEFEKGEKLIDDAILDSFDIITIAQEINETFSVNVNVEDLEPYNFNTVDAMIELIQNLQGQ